MSAPSETPDEASERLYSVKKLILAGKRLWLLGATWLLGLSAWTALAGDWSPWLSEHVPKPYRLVEMIWSLLSPQWEFAIAALVLAVFSFEDYHRNRTSQKSITPWFLLGCAVVSATLAVVSWTPGIESRSDFLLVPSKKIEDQKEIKNSIQRLVDQFKYNLEYQQNITESINKDLSDAKSRIAVQSKIINLSADIDIISGILIQYDQRMENFNANCMNDIADPSNVTEQTRLFKFSYTNSISEMAKLARVPIPSFTDLNGVDLNRPAPGQEKIPTEDGKYEFRNNYWKCKARALIIERFKSTLSFKLVDVKDGRAQAQSALRAMSQ